MQTRIKGFIFLSITLLLYIYQPFIPENTFLSKLFLDKYWAVALPCFGATFLYTLCMIFLGITFTFSYKKIPIYENENSETKKLK